MSEGFRHGQYRRLFHGTTAASAKKILEEGFKAGEDNCIWLTEDAGDAAGYVVNGLIEVLVSDVALQQMKCTIQGERIVCCQWDNDLVDVTRAYVKIGEAHWKEKQPTRMETDLRETLSKVISESYQEELDACQLEQDRLKLEFVKLVKHNV